MKKLLVIGSKGFIGSNVLSHFSEQPNFEVWGCDVVTDYRSKRYFLIDATSADFSGVFQREAFDVCINCSGAASVPDSMVNPLRDYHLNTTNVFYILEAIRHFSPTCKFLNLSSAAVYGNPQQLPIKESDRVSPLSPYGWHKYQSELLCQEYSRVHNIATASARIFSAFGPGLQKQLFWDWYEKVRSGNDITLWGTGNESRDFIFIEDVVSAIQCIVDRAPFQAESINVANGQEVFIRDAIDIFKEASGISFTYAFNNEVRKGDPVNWVANITLLSEFGYAPKNSFKAGIQKYIRWVETKG
jgi:dTDP-glucose 4,6-dehydratase/UDP-glucose 4-epimerase